MDQTTLDVQYAKLTEWLVKRRVCKANWNDDVLPIRTKINAAIQDMPAHDDITALLTGTYINYFHCLKIVEILKETEVDSKNIFGRYSSKRMKDWKEIVSMYENENVGLAEASQMLTRNVSYEVPALKKQVQRLTKAKQDCVRKEADYKSMSAEMRNKYAETCKSLGIEGVNVKQELLALASDLPATLDMIGSNCKKLEGSLCYYRQFVQYLNGGEDESTCKTLASLIKKGNITTYEWRTGEAPASIVSTALAHSPVSAHNTADVTAEKDELEVDWGDIDFGDEEGTTSQEINYDLDLDIELEDAGHGELLADLNEATVTSQDGVARGQDALSVLDNPATRFHFFDDLEELLCFLNQRLHDTSIGSDVIVMNIMQSAPQSVQVGEKEVSAMISKVQAVHSELSSPNLQKLLSIRNSPRYVERMTDNITKFLEQSEKMAASARLMSIRYKEAEDEIAATEPKIDVIRKKTLELKSQLESEISKKLKNRPINIMGEINLM